jgi:hypothetical protein
VPKPPHSHHITTTSIIHQTLTQNPSPIHPHLNGKTATHRAPASVPPLVLSPDPHRTILCNSTAPATHETCNQINNYPTRI